MDWLQHSDFKMWKRQRFLKQCCKDLAIGASIMAGWYVLFWLLVQGI